MTQMNWHDELRAKVARTMRELADRIDAEEDCMPSMTSIGDVDWTIKVHFPSEIPVAKQREVEMMARLDALREAAKTAPIYYDHGCKVALVGNPRDPIIGCLCDNEDHVIAYTACPILDDEPERCDYDN